MAAQRFEAVVQATEEGWLWVDVPAEVVAALGRGRRPRVVAEVNGFRFPSTLAAYAGASQLGFRREVREAARIGAGDAITVTLELDDAPREVEVPDDLDAALRADPVVAAAFAALSHTHRREYAEWVASARRDGTRRRRIERTVTLLRPGPKDT
jgi:hypothetical protein